MDVVQLPQGYRATTRRQFTFIRVYFLPYIETVHRIMRMFCKFTSSLLEDYIKKIQTGAHILQNEDVDTILAKKKYNYPQIKVKKGATFHKTNTILLKYLEGHRLCATITRNN